jgi:hypothetical protein
MEVLIHLYIKKITCKLPHCIEINQSRYGTLLYIKGQSKQIMHYITDFGKLNQYFLQDR